VATKALPWVVAVFPPRISSVVKERNIGRRR
jgi:hypothetical protein